jgi:alpha-D-xyloside xylohydrolase
MRAHGKQPREPWEYGDKATEIAKKYIKLRYRLLPYIYSEAVRSSKTSLPMVKPLVLDYQDDPNTENIDLEYLFGSSFLVAPLLTRTNKRRVYLPYGEWFDYWTKEKLTGGRWIHIDAPLDTLPLWVKAGEIIPLGPDMEYVNQVPLNPLTLEFYGMKNNGKLTIFDEDRPDIQINYSFDGSKLVLDILSPPPKIEIHWYGANVTSIICNQQILTIHNHTANYGQ